MDFEDTILHQNTIDYLLTTHKPPIYIQCSLTRETTTTAIHEQNLNLKKLNTELLYTYICIYTHTCMKCIVLTSSYETHT